jgi:hypothetical protein
MIKAWIKKTYSEKFDLYQRTFLLYALFFLFGLVPGVILASHDYPDENSLSMIDHSVWLFSRNSLLSVLWLYVFPFVFSFTLFGPFVSGVCIFLLGMKSGYIIRALLLASSDRFVMFFVCMSLYIALRFWILCMGVSFCTCVSYYLFEPEKDEKKMFGGSLFNAPYFRNLINVRFLFSYISIMLLLIFLHFAASVLCGVLLKMY